MTNRDETVEFHFQTPELRAIIIIGACLSLASWGRVLRLWEPLNGGDYNIWWGAFFALLFTLPTICGALLFWRGVVTLDACGIGWRLPLGRRFVAWDKIEALVIDRDYYLQTAARRVRLGTINLYPARLNELLDGVAARAWRTDGEWE